jgi:membrane protease YdiL (CAAX protease family)
MSAIPYHRLAAARRVRAVIEVVLSLAYWFAGTLILFALAIGDIYDELDEASSFLVSIVSLALLIPATRLAGRTLGRTSGSLSSVVDRLRWPWLMRCCAIALGFLVLAVAADAAVEGFVDANVRWPGWSTLLPLLAIIIVLVPFQAAGEEYLFRGTLVQAVGAWSASPWPAIVLSSVAFAAVHGAPIEVSVELFATAAMGAWLTYKTGGLEAAIAGHVVNNIVAFVLLAATGQRIDEVEYVGFTWISCAIYTLFYAAYAWAVVRMGPKHT